LFREVDGRKSPVEVVMVVDAVNIAYINLGNARVEIDKFLRAEGGHLAHPIAVAVFTDKGLQFLGDLSSDGNALSAALDQQIVGIRNSSVSRSAGLYGAVVRSSLSHKTLAQLAAFEVSRTGRKIVLWVFPSWPLLINPAILIDTKQQQESSIVSWHFLLDSGRHASRSTASIL
jgi:hypothetical protein